MSGCRRGEEKSTTGSWILLAAGARGGRSGLKARERRDSPQAERGIRLRPPRFGTGRVKQYRGEVRSARAESSVHWPLAWEGWSGRPEGRAVVRQQQKAPPERGFLAHWPILPVQPL